MKTVLVILGGLAIAMGALWIGQGTGYIHWPETSMMINDSKWAYYGAALAGLGLIAILYSQKKP